MSLYDRRYEVHAGMVAHYTDDPAKALRLLDSDPERGWCAEGYSEYRDVFDRDSTGGRRFAGTEVVRRQIGPVLRSTLEYRAQRAVAQHLIATLSRATL